MAGRRQIDEDAVALFGLVHFQLREQFLRVVQGRIGRALSLDVQADLAGGAVLRPGDGRQDFLLLFRHQEFLGVV